MKSWKTTLLGILTILMAVGGAVKAMIDNDPTTVPDLPVVIAAVTAGIGLIFAKDHVNP